MSCQLLGRLRIVCCALGVLVLKAVRLLPYRQDRLVRMPPDGKDGSGLPDVWIGMKKHRAIWLETLLYSQQERCL